MTFIHEARSALRALRKSPGYVATCVAVLALGIGANAAIFSVVHSVILTALSYPDASRLVFVWERFPVSDPLFGRFLVRNENYTEWKRQNTVFAEMTAMSEKQQSETGVENPRQISTGFASANLLPMLGAQARVGRLFRSDEERPGNDRVAVIADTYFETRFHRDPEVLGRSLTLSGLSYTIVGVLPRRFHMPALHEGTEQLKPEVWVPLSRRLNTADDEKSFQLVVMARLKPGVMLAQARTEMAGIAGRLAKSGKDALDKDWTVSVFPLEIEETAPQLHRALEVLLLAVGFLLLIACANLANLTLARATLRSREIALRLALGATRARIVTQLVLESFLVSIGGAALGLLLAHWCIKLMLALQPPDIHRPELIEINVAVFAYAAAAALFTALLFGLAPSVAASRMDLNSALKTGGGWGTSGARTRSRQFLIAVEVALALVLLTGAGLMIRSFRELVNVGIGFDTERLVTVDIDLPEKRYADGASQARFFRSLMEHLRSVPGVTAVALVDNLPLHSVSASNFYIAGRPELSTSAVPIADHALVSPEYFTAIGLRLKAGRFFTESDLALTDKAKEQVAIVNEAFVHQFFKNEEPLNKRLMRSKEGPASVIIGVVADYRPMGTERGVRSQIFWPDLRLRKASVIARTIAAPSSFAKAIQSAIWTVDKDLSAAEVKPMEHYVREWQSARRFNTLLLTIFAGLAVVLAMIGIYGVLSNLVTSRVREIGIRMAIGARPLEIARLIVRQSMIPVMIGLAGGLAGSLVVNRFLESLLFQVHPRDPLTLIVACGAILLMTPLAVSVPLRRALRVDCTVALREE